MLNIKNVAEGQYKESNTYVMIFSEQMVKNALDLENQWRTEKGYSKLELGEINIKETFDNLEDKLRNDINLMVLLGKSLVLK